MEVLAMCAILSLALFGPRIVAIIWWLADGARWTLTFGENFLLPAAGILFLPWTTIMYVLVFPEGLSTLDIVGLIVAAIADFGSYLGGGVKGRSTYSGYRSTPPPTSSPPAA
jgi:hypothetical protein